MNKLSWVTATVAAATLAVVGAATPSLAAVAPHGGPAHAELYSLHDPLKTMGDGFGHGVAISSNGKTVLVGSWQATGGNGAAYLYTSAHHASPVATFKDPSNAGAHFGYSVALSPSGTTAYITADKANVGARTAGGATYVYEQRKSGAWPTSPTYTISDPGTGTNDFFGVGIALSPDGSTLVVGAPGFTVASTFEVGQAYVYTASNGKFPSTPSATIKSPNPTRGFFGYSVSVSKDTTGHGTLIVGAYVTSHGSISDTGAAYIYAQKSAHTWALAKGGTLGDPGNLANDFFGGVVTIDGAGTLAMVGAQDETEKTVSDAGAVFTYADVSGTWKREQTLDGPADGAANFSSPSISANGAVAVMGAPNEQVHGNSYAGEASVYDGNGKSYALASSILDPTGGSPTGQEYFGAPSAESQNGDTTIIGAPATTGAGGAPGPGAVYVYNTTP